MADEKKPDNPSDLIAVGPPLPNGDVAFVRQRQEGESTVIEGGTMRVLSEVPSAEETPEDTGEVLRLGHLHDNVYEVQEVVHKDGPAMVNNAAYRTGWETIFGKRQTVGQA